MSDMQKPQELSDDILEDVEGGGVMATPVGGWGVTATDRTRGVWKAPAGTEADATKSLRNDISFAQSGVDPKI